MKPSPRFWISDRTVTAVNLGSCRSGKAVWSSRLPSRALAPARCQRLQTGNKYLVKYNMAEASIVVEYVIDSHHVFRWWILTEFPSNARFCKITSTYCVQDVAERLFLWHARGTLLKDRRMIPLPISAAADTKSNCVTPSFGFSAITELLGIGGYFSRVRGPLCSRERKERLRDRSRIKLRRYFGSHKSFPCSRPVSERTAQPLLPLPDDHWIAHSLLSSNHLTQRLAVIIGELS